MLLGGLSNENENLGGLFVVVVVLTLIIYCRKKSSLCKGHFNNLNSPVHDTIAFPAGLPPTQKV